MLVSLLCEKLFKFYGQYASFVTWKNPPVDFPPPKLIPPSVTSEKIYRKSNCLLYLTENKIKVAEVQSNFIIISFKTLEKLSLIAAGFYFFYHFCSDLDQIFKNKNGCNNLNPAIVASNKVYSIDSLKSLNV